MKVTKVAKTRIAVSGRETTQDGRGVLYPTPNASNIHKTVEEQVEERVKNANKLYGVFFRSDIPEEVEKHFCELVKIAVGSKSPELFLESASAYKGYSWEDKKGKSGFKGIQKFQYGSATKNMNSVMNIHVRERMVDAWQVREYKNAAVKILLCICNADYKKEIGKLELETVENFLMASKSCQKPYITKSTTELEQIFTDVMKQLVLNKKKNATQRIWWMQNQLKIAEIKNGRDIKKVKLDEFHYEYATEDRMEAVLVRMRKSIKRGTNGEIAVQLLQGIAQMDGRNLSDVLTGLSAKEETKEALKKFLNAVDEDYHKNAVIKSIKNHDVKVQVHEGGLDLSSVNVEKVSQKKKNKGALNMTLERYAASPESSVETLKEIKEIVLDYFLWKEPEVVEEFTTDAKLWNIPNRVEEYFDVNFVPVDDKKDEKVEARVDLASIFVREKVKNSDVKKRINYVNCGKYQQMVKNETEEFRLYWIGYVKDYVEKNYVSKKRTLRPEDCYSTKMLFECWKDVIRFICGKYIDIGKAVYHFAMPEEMSAKGNVAYGVLDEKYQDGISSFAYEAIKAEENIQRDIANATVAAAAAFSRSVLDEEKHQKGMEQEKNLEDIMFMSENAFLNCVKEEELILKQVLRFYGGYSKIQGREKLDGTALAKEVLSHIKAIRNENFHFTKGKAVQLDDTCAKLLWENEREEFKQVVKEKYYSNNVAMFYSKEQIQSLVTKLYQKNAVSEAQIPAFRTIWQRKLLPEYISGLNCPWNRKMEADKTVLFEGALYFLLKEIYYRDFILTQEAKKLFFEAVDNYATETATALEADRRNNEKKALANAGKNFKLFVDGLRSKEVTFGEVCQFINTEYNQQNRGKQEEEIYKHFKMLLPLCIRRAFQKYVDVHYAFIKKPVYVEKTTEEYLENINVACMEMNPELVHWYTFAHFIHPRQLNFLVGNFKDYIQYREDVVRRAGYAGQFAEEEERNREIELVSQTVEKAKDILEVLEFVRHISGRVSNEFSDYYADQDSYKKYMSQYIAADVVLENYDIYGDAKNAKLLRNVEIARMFAGGDFALPCYPKITKKEVEQYYAQKGAVAKIQSQGLCRSMEEQMQVVAFQKLKNRITLNDVTELFALINDLLGQLVSLSYLRERDEMYLFLGFYYMALRNTAGWMDENLDSVSTEKYAVEKGLVLYQTVAVFDFGTKLLYQEKDGKWQETNGMKWGHFIRNHMDSYNCIIPLFEVAKYAEKATALRNYVDHSKYYVKQDKSLLELYSQFYTNSFGYSSKLRKSVLFNLENTLEKYFISAKLKFDGVTNVVLDEKTKSQDFTYKYEELDTKKNKKIIKTIQIPAKSDIFVNAVCELLKYKK